MPLPTGPAVNRVTRYDRRRGPKHFMTWMIRHRVSRPFPFRLLIVLFVAGQFVASARAAEEPGDQGFLERLARMSLEELGEMQVTSVVRRQAPLEESAASLYVITAEDIRRSGATTLPEVLRLAPNLQVARQSSVSYAISARGFNNAVGNKLLVLIDGRLVYTPVFSGVFWEMQDTMLEDIARIEVISGPGATLWGTNAVNGVINITTLSSGETRSAFFGADWGTDERGAAARFGGEIGPAGTYRVYARGRSWDRTFGADGFNARDEWDRQQAGFRADWQYAHDQLTVQGDVYTGRSEHRGFAGAFEITPHEIAGHHVLGRWTRSLASGGDLQVQAYYDRLHREELIIFQPDVRTTAIEFQHTLPLESSAVLWGGGYRRASDDVEPGVFSSFRPASRSMEWYNLFVHQELSVKPGLDFTWGLRVESNPFTGVEYLPNLRLAWDGLGHGLLWGSASRAVRSPSRYDRDVFFPQEPPFVVAGGAGFVSEVAEVLEVGYRTLGASRFSLAVTAFHHEWDRLRSGTGLPLPINLVNNIQGSVTGIEGWGHWQATPRWRLSAGFLAMDKDLAFRAGTQEDAVGVDNATLHNDPDHQWMLRSRSDVGERVELDFYLRGVDELTVEPVPGYVELDVRVGIRLAPTLDLSLVGTNLLHSRHGEFGPVARRSEFERAAHVRLEWRP